MMPSIQRESSVGESRFPLGLAQTARPNGMLSPGGLEQMSHDYANGDPNFAAASSSASISSRRLYFAMGSLRLAEPGLIRPPPIATVKSPRILSSLQPGRRGNTDRPPP